VTPTEPDTSFSIAIHAANRLRYIDVLLRSLEKNSCFEHELVIVADGADKLLVRDEHSLGDYRHVSEYFDQLESKHEVRIIPTETSHVREYGETAPNLIEWFRSWHEGLNIGLAQANREWVLMGVQDDMYFAPNWDLNLHKWLCHRPQTDWLAPVSAYTYSLGPEITEASRTTHCYPPYFERYNTATDTVERFEGRSNDLHMTVREDLFFSWLKTAGFLKPGKAVLERGGIRRCAGEAPTLIRKSLFLEMGSYDLSAFSNTNADLCLDLDNKLGAHGYSKLAVQDSFTLQLYNPLLFDEGARGGLGGTFDFDAALEIFVPENA